MAKLQEINEHRLREQAEKTDRLKNLDFDLSRTQAKIEDFEKLIDAKIYDLRNK